MENAIARVVSPQEQELSRQQIQLEALELELTQRELDLATLQAELHKFEREYFQVVGVRYAELDKIEVELAQYLAYLNPKDFRLRERAEQARAKAQASQQAVRETHHTPATDFQPPESLKKLYREVAKRIHPDLATHEAERQHRLNLMIQANRAYEEGNTALLEALLQDGEFYPEAVQGEDIEAQVLRVQRKIKQVRLRLTAIATEIQALKQSPLAQIREQVAIAHTQGRNFLSEMAFQLDEERTILLQHLTELKEKAGF